MNTNGFWLIPIKKEAMTNIQHELFIYLEGKELKDKRFSVSHWKFVVAEAVLHL